MRRFHLAFAFALLTAAFADTSSAEAQSLNLDVRTHFSPPRNVSLEIAEPAPSPWKVALPALGLAALSPAMIVVGLRPADPEEDVPDLFRYAAVGLGVAAGIASVVLTLVAIRRVPAWRRQRHQRLADALSLRTRF